MYRRLAVGRPYPGQTLKPPDTPIASDSPKHWSDEAMKRQIIDAADIYGKLSNLL